MNKHHLKKSTTVVHTSDQKQDTPFRSQFTEIDAPQKDPNRSDAIEPKYDQETVELNNPVKWKEEKKAEIKTVTHPVKHKHVQRKTTIRKQQNGNGRAIIGFILILGGVVFAITILVLSIGAYGVQGTIVGGIIVGLLLITAGVLIINSGNTKENPKQNRKKNPDPAKEDNQNKKHLIIALIAFLVLVAGSLVYLML